MKIQRRVCRNERRESAGQFLTVSKVRSTDHIREDEIREEYVRKSSAYDCIFCSDYHEPCNVGMVPIFCAINYK